MKKLPPPEKELTARKKQKKQLILDEEEMCEVCGRRPGIEIHLCPTDQEHHCNCCATCANKCYALNEEI